MTIEHEIIMVHKHYVFCDCCGEPAPDGTTEFAAKDHAFGLGWRIGVQRDGETQDLCEDCYLMWQRECKLEAGD